MDGDFSGNVCRTPTFFGKYVSYPNKLPKICVVPLQNPFQAVTRFIYDRSLIHFLPRLKHKKVMLANLPVCKGCPVHPEVFSSEI